MSERAIKKLRRKFIWSAFLSFVTVMFVMGGMIYILNLHSTMAYARSVLNFISDNGGNILESDNAFERKSGRPIDDSDTDPFTNFLNDVFHTGIDSSPEFRYSTRYFSVKFNSEGKASSVDTGSIFAVSSNQAIEYAKSAVEKKRTYGSVGDYYYKLTETDDQKLVVFVDCSVGMSNIRRLLNIELTLIIFGSIMAYVLIRVLSSKMIRPEIKNAERQKQFITNAGHELKTPLAVIKANTELEMMINGENEWNQSTMRQIDHMTELIKALITIARSEEKPDEKSLTDVDVSKTANEVADSFASVAANDEKILEKKIADGVVMKADEGKIRQLITILTDNAIKYCDDKGKISIKLTAKGRNIRFAVYNDYANGNNEECSKYFERFYRADNSHNIDKGGYGIGLSIAESIVRSFKGNISASWSDGVICFLCQFKI